MKKSTLLKLVMITTCMSLSGCSTSTNDDSSEEENYIPLSNTYEYYDNFQFNAFYNKDVADKHLPNQGIYGSGNAFILRYNGLYYMYLGGSNYLDNGIACYVSEDLMTWKEVDNGINAKGRVAEDPRLYFSYPPCVRQFNGKFYCYIYIKNNLITQGNYILEADKPEGPFKFILGDDGEPVCYTIKNTSLDIDCDIFIDDNEDAYFMSARQDSYFTGIRAFKMSDDMREVYYDNKSYINIADSSVGGWTEGNGIFKRNGMYYLMYTGSNILSPGYLTHYSTAIDDSWKKGFGTKENLNAPGFKMAPDFPMGCETQPQFYGLGHATSVLGPDMDGIYYHYFNVNSAGPNCSFAIDRLIFNGSTMDTAQAQFHSLKPSRPSIYSYAPFNDDKFEEKGKLLISKESTKNVYSAEFNFTGDNVKCIFDYADDNNYAYVKTNLQSKKVTLLKVSNGVENIIGEGNIRRKYDANNLLQTIRVAYRDGKIDVYFDDLLKINNQNIELNGGKLGYKYDGSFTPQYTAASNVAKGLSDAIEPKQSFINIGAESYLPSGIYETIGSKFSSNSGFSYVDKNEYSGKYEKMGKMNLLEKGDKASYLVDFADTRDGKEGRGFYSLFMTLNANMKGKKIGVKVNGGEVYNLCVPDVLPDNGEKLIKVELGMIPVTKGVNDICFVNVGDEFSFHSFTFGKASSTKFSYEVPLDKAPEKGMEQISLYRFEQLPGDEKPSLYCKEGARSLVYFGDNSVKDYKVECDFRLNGESISTAGFILEGNRYSNSPYVSEDYKYMQGYYVSLGRKIAKIEKLNYSHTDSAAASTRVNLKADKWNHVIIEKNANVIKVSIINDENKAVDLIFNDDIAFVDGRFGFYSAGASMSYKNLKING